MNEALKLKNHYTTEEALAVARLAWNLIFSNKEVRKSESAYFEALLEALQLSIERFRADLQQPIEMDLEQIRSMTAKKRLECGVVLREAIMADHAIDLSEMTRLNEILKRANILKPDVDGKKKDDLNLN